jgi:hypothetical protein
MASPKNDFCSAVSGTGYAEEDAACELPAVEDNPARMALRYEEPTGRVEANRIKIVWSEVRTGRDMVKLHNEDALHGAIGEVSLPKGPR